MKNTAIPVLLFSALAAAVHFQHEHAYLHHKRAYNMDTKTAIELTTLMKVVTPNGPLPAGATPYSPEEAAQLTKNSYAEHVSAFPAELPPSYTPPPPAPAAESTSITIIEPAKPKPLQAAPPPPPPPVAPAKPAPTYVAPPPVPSAHPSTIPPTIPGGTGKPNPYFPQGPKVGETAKDVRLSPFRAYWLGEDIQGHIGACGNRPYRDTDPQLSKSDSRGDKKFMFHPPVISGNKYTDILQYCGAILNVTGPDGATTTGTVVDLCEDCGGPGGIDLMKASWVDMFKNVAHGDCVYGASWVLTGWINLLPALS